MQCRCRSQCAPSRRLVTAGFPGAGRLKMRSSVPWFRMQNFAVMQRHRELFGVPVPGRLGILGVNRIRAEHLATTALTQSYQRVTVQLPLLARSAMDGTPSSLFLCLESCRRGRTVVRTS